MFKRLGISLLVTGLLMSLMGFVGSSAQASPYCDPYTKVTYRQVQWNWKSYDHGQINNSSRSGSATVNYSYSHSYSLSSTISSSASVSLGTALVGASASLDISVTGSASFTKDRGFSVTAGPRSNITWRNGVIQRDILVTRKQMFTNCDTKTSSGYLHAADNYLRVADA